MIQRSYVSPAVIFLVFLGSIIIGSSSTTVTADQMAIWTFDGSPSFAHGVAMNAKTEVIEGEPAMTMYNQDIDANGKDGIEYTDVEGTLHPADQAAAWDDIKGSGDDAALHIVLNTTGWQDIAFRFDYKSDSADTFDLEYSTDGGTTWAKPYNNEALTADYDWHAKTVDLTAEDALEDQTNVILKIDDLDNNGNDRFVFDNFEITGTMIASPLMAIWTFDGSPSFSDGQALDPTTFNVQGSPIMTMYNQDIDANGKGGIEYTDVEGTLHPADQAAAWDDIKGSGDDAALHIVLNTTGWRDIAFRFDYKSDSADTFDLEYSTDGGTTWTKPYNNEALSADYDWHAKTVDLTAEDALEDQTNVILKIDDLDNNGNDRFVFDNFEITGTKIPAGYPTLTVAVTTTDYIDLNENGAGALSAVLFDPMDPGSTIGIDFILTDPDTPLANIIVSVSSDNQTVVPDANLILSGSDADWHLTIGPTGIGYATITVEAHDGTNSGTYTIYYACSAAGGNGVFHTGASDASSAVAIDNHYMFVADDEDQKLRLFSRTDSGASITFFDFSTDFDIAVSDEVDHESSTRVGDRIYWAGSHSNSSGGNDKPERERIYATDLNSAGSNATLSFVGYYEFLEDDLLAWDASNGHGLGADYYGLTASAADGVPPEQADGFSIEGMSMAPGSSNTAYIAFRAPLVPTAGRTNALIVPVTNFTTIVDTTAPTGSATFGSPIELDLGGRGVRSIECDTDGCLIIAGPAGSAAAPPDDFRLYTWSGNANDTPEIQPADLTAINSGGSYETIVELPDLTDLTSIVQLLNDNGDTVWYDDGIISKDLNRKQHQKFRSDRVMINELLPVILNDFSGELTKHGVLLRWATTLEIDILGFHIYRSERPIHDTLHDQRISKFIRITEEMIIARGSDIHGFRYLFLDRDMQMNSAYTYYLQAIAIDNEAVPLDETTVLIQRIPINDREIAAADKQNDKS